MDPCMPLPPPDPNAHHALKADSSGPVDEGVPEEFLHPCCQKDLQEKRVRDKVLTKVRAADRAAQALARRRGVVVGVGQDAAAVAEWARHRHEHGSGCCELMVDYPALARLRSDRGLYPSSQPEEEEAEPPGYNNDEDEDEDEDEEDSDDELLRELEDFGGGGGFMEVRVAEMLRRAEEAAELRQLGVGLHTEPPPVRILRLVHLRCPALVAHLYRPHAPLSAAMDLALEELAAQYPGTRFVRAPFVVGGGEVVGRLRVPAAAVAAAEAADGGSGGLLLAVRDGCLVDACGDYGRRFADRGSGPACVYGDAVEQWLRHCQVLVREAPDLVKARRMLGALERRVQGEVKGQRGLLRRGGQRGDSDYDSEEEEEEVIYECGLAGCRKAFAHSHVGMDGVNLPREFGSVGGNGGEGGSAVA